MSRRLVAAITTIRSRAPKPSSSTSSWLSVPSRSESAPEAPWPRARPMASISSKKMMAPVSLLRASANRSRTREAPDADVGVHEVGARERVEGDAGLAGDGLGEQRLAGPGRAVQDHAVRHPGADPAEALGLAQEDHDLLELLHGLVAAGHVAEAHGRRLDLGALADGAVPRCAAAAPARRGPGGCGPG